MMTTSPLLNTTLVAYGIQNEGSDIRVHVCFKAKHVYVYPTEQAKVTIARKPYRQAPAYQAGIKTAMGFLVPPQDIEGCQWYPIPPSWIVHPRLQILDTHSPGEKGDRATRIVANMLALHKMPLPLSNATVHIMQDTTIQMQGIDLSVHVDIQVKCDLAGGHQKYGGTGNLFLQTHECNPFNIWGETAKERRPTA